MARLLTADEMAEILDINARTLIKWARDGYIPAHGLGEGKRKLWRFVEAEVLKWAENK